MRTSLLTTAALVLVCALDAQPLTEGIQIFPGRGNDGVTFISRLGVSSAVKLEGLAEYPAAFLEGVGDVSTAGGASNLDCRLSHVIFYFQDQNPSTTHQFDLVMRPAKPSGTGPDLSANPVFRLNNLPTPQGTGTQPKGIGLILTFQSGGKVQPVAIPCSKTVFFGMALNANLNWPASDGLSLYEACYDPASVSPTAKGDNVAPRTNVPNLSWRVTGSAPNMTASNNFTGRVLAYALVSPGPMLQVGAVHARSFHSSKIGFGAAGMFPTISAPNRQDGLAIRITDNARATRGGRYLLFLALNTNSSLARPPLHLGGLTGNVYLGPLLLLPVTAGALATNSADTILTLAATGQIPAAAVGTNLYFQAATADISATTGGVTNLGRVSF
jgi:hypothetical protein